MSEIHRNRQAVRRSARRGAAVVETAVVLSVCLLMIFTIFDYGRLLMVRNLLDNAARQGARVAVTNTSTMTTQNIQTTVTNLLAGQNLQNLTISVYKADPTTGNNTGVWTDASQSDCIAVEITGTYSPMLPRITLLPTTMTLHSKAMMYSEAN